MFLWCRLTGSFLQPIEFDRNIHRRNVVLVDIRLGLLIDRVNKPLLSQEKSILGPRDFNPEISRQRLVGGDLESHRELVLESLDMGETLVEDDGIIDVVEDVGHCAVSLLPLIQTRIHSILLESDGDHIIREKREPRIRCGQGAATDELREKRWRP